MYCPIRDLSRFQLVACTKDRIGKGLLCKLYLLLMSSSKIQRPVWRSSELQILRAFENVPYQLLRRQTSRPQNFDTLKHIRIPSTATAPNRPLERSLYATDASNRISQTCTMTAAIGLQICSTGQRYRDNMASYVPIHLLDYHEFVVQLLSYHLHPARCTIFSSRQSHNTMHAGGTSLSQKSLPLHTSQPVCIPIRKVQRNGICASSTRHIKKPRPPIAKAK